ncbi:MAG: hypothetical protein LBQ56_05650, partial [Synergistaceae bacterium]|nr:hypothetical protein [Synergistaceae bacterium]
MMFDDLAALLSYVGRPDAGREDYRRAVVTDNCLGKRSARTRGLSFKHLADLYSLDASNAIFSAMLFFWSRDVQARPLLA